MQMKRTSLRKMRARITCLSAEIKKVLTLNSVSRENSLQKGM